MAFSIQWIVFDRGRAGKSLDVKISSRNRMARARARADVIDLPSKAHGRSIRVSSERVPYHSSLSGRASSRIPPPPPLLLCNRINPMIFFFSLLLYSGVGPPPPINSFLRSFATGETIKESRREETAIHSFSFDLVLL